MDLYNTTTRHNNKTEVLPISLACIYWCRAPCLRFWTKIYLKLNWRHLCSVRWIKEQVNAGIQREDLTLYSLVLPYKLNSYSLERHLEMFTGGRGELCSNLKCMSYFTQSLPFGHEKNNIGKGELHWSLKSAISISRPFPVCWLAGGLVKKTNALFRLNLTTFSWPGAYIWQGHNFHERYKSKRLCCSHQQCLYSNLLQLPCTASFRAVCQATHG